MKPYTPAIIAAAAIGCFLVSYSLAATMNEPINNETPKASKDYPVTVNQLAGPPKVAGERVDAQGRPIMVNCSTCHATRTPNPDLKSAADLKEFHQGLTFKHGDLSCLACHNPGDYDTLRLADGKTVEYTNVMTLCAQCHGPQHRDYQNGSHGGMTGYWDLKQGPRQRNNCVDCHDPHYPAFQGMIPAPGPRDRFHTPKNTKVTGESEHHE